MGISMYTNTVEGVVGEIKEKKYLKDALSGQEIRMQQ
jgi:hypothetical protein